MNQNEQSEREALKDAAMTVLVNASPAMDENYRVEQSIVETWRIKALGEAVRSYNTRTHQAQAGGDLVELLRRIEPHIDAIVCYASTMDEHEPNRLAVDLRAYLSALPQQPALGELSTLDKFVLSEYHQKAKLGDVMIINESDYLSRIPLSGIITGAKTADDLFSEGWTHCDGVWNHPALKDDFDIGSAYKASQHSTKIQQYRVSSDTTQLLADMEVMAEALGKYNAFFGDMWEDYCDFRCDNGELIYSSAEKYGLIVSEAYDPDIHGSRFSEEWGAEKGDPYYKDAGLAEQTIALASKYNVKGA